MWGGVSFLFLPELSWKGKQKTREPRRPCKRACLCFTVTAQDVLRDFNPFPFPPHPIDIPAVLLLNVKSDEKITGLRTYIEMVSFLRKQR